MIKPAVDRLQTKLGERFRVIKINIHSQFGISLTKKYLTRTVPSFLIFDANGKEVNRLHKVPKYEFLMDISGKTGDS